MRDEDVPIPPAGLPIGVDAEVGPGSDEDRIWATLARWRAERRRFALLTVVETRGSAPRKSGTHLLLADDGETVGTLGGGAIEHEALERARAVLARGGTEVLRRDLTRDLGMCCGGEMTVFVEAVEPRPRLFVFGAGYIGRPLVAMATACGFEVTVVDGRPEWADPARFPGAAVRCQDPEDAARALELAPVDYACVVTHDHALDQRVVQALVRRPLRFLGMVGSRTKQRRFVQRLRGSGLGEAELAALHTPLGLAIGATTPEEIAVSVLAQLIAVRRGVTVDAGWYRPEEGTPAEDTEATTEQATDADAAPGEAPGGAAGTREGGRS
jgi:xanthine dehydrogenase accessory factor